MTHWRLFQQTVPLGDTGSPKRKTADRGGFVFYAPGLYSLQKGSVDQSMNEGNTDQTPPAIHPESLALIAQSARKALDAFFDDYRTLKREAQQTLTTSAVLLGILLNLARTPAAGSWETATAVMLIITTVLLGASTVISLGIQFLHQFPTGYIDPQYLYDNYAVQSPTEVYRVELGGMIPAIPKAQERLKRLAWGVDGARIIVLIAVILIGIALLLSLDISLNNR